MVIYNRSKEQNKQKEGNPMMTIKKLSSHPYSQCHVEIAPNGDVNFFSYATLVCCIESGWLSCTGLYSATTRKQIGWFLKEYAPDITYAMVKQCVEDSMAINTHTGEIVPE